MAGVAVAVPKFQKKQRVHFLGGEGVIRSYRAEAGTWNYLVEMAMAPEPEFGRVGNETTIVLNETDIQPLEGELCLV